MDIEVYAKYISILNTCGGLGQISSGLQNEQLCVAAMIQNSENITHVANLTLAMLMEVAKFNPAIISQVQAEMQTFELCMLVVQQNGILIKYVAPHLQTPELCFAAIDQYPDALGHIHEITPAVCMYALNKGSITVLALMPQDSQTAEVCAAAIKTNPLAIKHVRADLQTPELCMEAVTINGIAIANIAKDKHTYELCLAAIKNNTGAAEFIDQELLNSGTFTIEAIRCNSAVAKYLKSAALTKEIYLELIKHDLKWMASINSIDVVFYICEQQQNYECINFCNDAIKQKIKGITTTI
jgi:hypothetical protein